MLSRNILIVDDDENINDTIQEYYEIYQELQTKYGFEYEINFSWEKTIQSAIERLNKKEEVFDVTLIDYDFSNDIEGLKGIHLVSQIRETINKRCRIVFYTMHGLSFLVKEDLVSLINNDVFRFISKSGEMLSIKYEAVGEKADQIIVEALIDALDTSDPISNSLERYLIKYSEVLKDINFSFGDEKYTIMELVNSIRLYKEPGNTFVNNLLEMSVIDYLETN
jgi:CheY-like chemotaxis protein